jgi:hypothetical protein
MYRGENLLPYGAYYFKRYNVLLVRLMTNEGTTDVAVSWGENKINSENTSKKGERDTIDSWRQKKYILPAENN